MAAEKRVNDTVTIQRKVGFKIGYLLAYNYLCADSNKSHPIPIYIEVQLQWH